MAGGGVTGLPRFLQHSATQKYRNDLDWPLFAAARGITPPSLEILCLSSVL